MSSDSDSAALDKLLNISKACFLRDGPARPPCSDQSGLL